MSFIKLIIKFLLSIILFFLIASFGLPIFLDFLIVLIIVFLVRFSFYSLIILNFSILVISILANKALINSFDGEKNVFYRSHEKFYYQNGIYKKNINSQMTMSHGDILAIDYCDEYKNKDIKEPRFQEFITDENGYRNNGMKISDAEIILVGDSFIAGSSNTQAHTPTNILQNITKKNTYSFTVISDPKNYELNLINHIDKINPKAKIFIFYFAGNDFEYEMQENDKFKYFKNKPVSNFKYSTRFAYESLERSKDRFFIKRWDFIYKRNFFYKKIRPQSQRYYKKILAKWTDTCPVSYHQINSQDVGFYYQPINTYKSVSTHIIKNPKILEKIEAIIFIPIKYNVYKKFIDNQNIDKNDFEFLKNNYDELGVKVIDLTEFLELSAEKYHKQGEFIYWRDDTHWNINGINEVMKKIEELIAN